MIGTHCGQETCTRPALADSVFCEYHDGFFECAPPAPAPAAKVFEHVHSRNGFGVCLNCGDSAPANVAKCCGVMPSGETWACALPYGHVGNHRCPCHPAPAPDRSACPESDDGSHVWMPSNKFHKTSVCRYCMAYEQPLPPAAETCPDSDTGTHLAEDENGRCVECRNVIPPAAETGRENAVWMHREPTLPRWDRCYWADVSHCPHALWTHVTFVPLAALEEANAKLVRTTVNADLYFAKLAEWTAMNSERNAALATERAALVEAKRLAEWALGKIDGYDHIKTAYEEGITALTASAGEGKP